MLIADDDRCQLLKVGYSYPCFQLACQLSGADANMMPEINELEKLIGNTDNPNDKSTLSKSK